MYGKLLIFLQNMFLLASVSQAQALAIPEKNEPVIVSSTEEVIEGIYYSEYKYMTYVGVLCEDNSNKCRELGFFADLGCSKISTSDNKESTDYEYYSSDDDEKIWCTVKGTWNKYSDGNISLDLSKPKSILLRIGISEPTEQIFPKDNPDVLDREYTIIFGYIDEYIDRNVNMAFIRLCTEKNRCADVGTTLQLNISEQFEETNAVYNHKVGITGTWVTLKDGTVILDTGNTIATYIELSDHEKNCVQGKREVLGD